MADADLTIRPLAEQDWDDWLRLWTGYLTFYEAEVAPAVYETTWARLLSGAAGEYRGLIAQRGGRAVGIAHFLFHRHCWRVEDVCYLQDLYVDAAVRGGGVGRALIEAVYTAADGAGAPVVYWTTQHFNASARQLYDRIGVETPFIKYQRR
ncbi:MAG: GNAT family N-acetyltransferase [Pseudomonadota bacterium]